MSWNDCTKEEQEVILKSLKAALDGPFFPEWEFFSLIGAERKELKEIIEEWDVLDKDSKEVKSIISNVIGGLISYPHGYKDLIKKYIYTFADEEYLYSTLIKMKQCLP